MLTCILVLLVLSLHVCTVSTSGSIRLDNLDVVVDGTNITLTLLNGDNGKREWWPTTKIYNVFQL